ncbi:phospholipase D family protein [Pseudoduganella sp. R-34]|jgi:phosphatidylserine/phosphatidylglycerophosphate/cardiolipin synthase-like enzyme|uniref:phospholipase D family nuclease n=1 Tax=Pseudoduganella sp. R-34 TaxID=3404062 RepID=UPI003CF40D16
MKVVQITIVSVLFALAAGQAAAAAPTTCPNFEVGFSPEGSAEALVLKTIRSARQDIKILAYSFTAKEVVKELIDARRRNVNVAIVADASNLSSRYSVAALSALSSAGASVRTIDKFAIHHDKAILVDGQHVEFGSYNFSAAAATKNSENANVCWHSPSVAAKYLEHWQSRWNLGTTFQPRY